MTSHNRIAREFEKKAYECVTRMTHTRRVFLKTAAASAALAAGAGSLRSEPKGGGTLRIQKSQPVNALDSHRGAGFAYNKAGWQICSSFIYLLPDGGIVPSLFNGWKFLDDGSRAVF